MEEKFNLKWNDFQHNIVNSFRTIRNQSKYCDVTLVSNDQRQISAHRVVLTACSEYFDNILSSNTHSHPLVCLDGLSYEHLKMLVDYVYNGEVQVRQDNLEDFLKVSQRFRLKGLLNGFENGDDMESTFENSKNQIDTKYDTSELKTDMKGCIAKQDEVDHSISLNKPLKKAKNSGQDFIFNSSEFSSIDALDQSIQSMVSSQNGYYCCNECNYASKHPGHVREHAERHISGLSFLCQHCERTMKTRHAFRSHLNKCLYLRQ